MNLHFSKFAHRFERDGTVCFMNSLRLRPVYAHHNLTNRIDEARRTHPAGPFEFEPEGDDESLLIKELLNEKILAEDGCDVDRAIERARDRTGDPYPQVMYAVVTTACNLRCSYCFVKSELESETRGGLRMTASTIRRCVDRFAALIRRDSRRWGDEKLIVFYGGEPLSNFACVSAGLQHIAQLKRDGSLPGRTATSIVTNGTLLSEPIADELARHEVGIAVSLDGATERLNANRAFASGRPAYPHVMESIRLLRSKGIRFSLSITVSDSALDDQDSLLDSLADLGVADIGFNPILPSQHYQVSADYGERFADFLITAHMRLRELGFVEDRMRRKIEAFARAQVMFGDCAAAGGGQVVFSPEGRIGICHGMPADAEWFPGHVDDPDFEPASSPLFLEWSRYSPIFKDQCEGCGALGICGGGCPLRAYQSRGSWQAVDEQFCHHAKKTLDFLVWELFQTLDGQDSAGRSAAP